jgi:hypothetical protein
VLVAVALFDVSGDRSAALVDSHQGLLAEASRPQEQPKTGDTQVGNALPKATPAPELPTALGGDEAAAPAYSVDAIRARLSGLRRKNPGFDVAGVLKPFGVTRVSDLDSRHYEALMSQLEQTA